jgi:hypothetical protein
MAEKFQLTKQAKIFVIVASLALFLNMLITSFMFGINGFLAYIIIFIILTPFLALNIYNINCLSVGKCERWAWVNSVLSIIYIVYITFVMVLMATVKI